MYSKLLELPNIVGADEGFKTRNGERLGKSTVVMVTKKVPKYSLALHEIIPEKFEGVETDVMEVGEIIAPRPPEPQIMRRYAVEDRTDRWRPAPGGVSIGHYKITAGTLGCICYDVRTGNKVILSNNHVLANSNAGVAGDEILQPGPHDGGDVDKDVIATLLRFVPIKFTEEGPSCPISIVTAKILNFLARAFGSSHEMKVIRTSTEANEVDAAIAVPLNADDISDHILEVPITPTEVADVSLGDKVLKSGRTTGYTESEVLIVGATVTVNYGDNRYATFENQFVTGPMSAGGDSGSLILNAEYKGVGLLFAGSEQITINNLLVKVFDALDLSF